MHSHNFLNSIAYVLLLNALIFQETVSLAYGWCSIVCFNYNILPQRTIVFSIMCVFVFEECFLLHSEFQLGEVSKHLVSVLQAIPGRSKQTQFSSLSKTRDQCPTLGMWAAVFEITTEPSWDIEQEKIKMP